MMPRFHVKSLKSILQHIEANIRFRIYLQMPLIRSIEKSVPLRIYNLQLDNNQISVNNIIYTLGIYREYPKNVKVPIPFERDNSRGGVKFDLDQHGFQVVLSKGDIQPGEIGFGDLSERRKAGEFLFPAYWQKDDEEKRLMLERNLEVYEIALKKRLEKKSQRCGHQLEEYGAKISFLQLFDSEELRNPLTKKELKLKLSRLDNFSTTLLKELVEVLECCLQPYRCLKQNSDLPFTPTLQLTVYPEDLSGPIYKYHYPYFMKLHEAMRQLNRILFGQRPYLRVNLFKFDMMHRVLRTPKGFGIKIRNLTLEGDIQPCLEGLRKIIIHKSLPLQNFISIRFPGNVYHFNNNVVKSAKQIYLMGDAPPNFMEFLNLTCKLKKVIFQYSNRTYSVEEMFPFAQKMVAEKFPLDYVRWFGNVTAETFKALCLKLKKELNGEISPTEVWIPMEYKDKFLLILYQTSDTMKPKKDQRWIVKMMVVKVIEVDE